MQYKGLLFDFDGTLLDTNDLILDTFHHVIEPKFPGKYSREALQKFIGPSLKDSFTEVDAKNVDVLIAEYITWNRQHHDELVKEFPDVVEVLTRLKESGLKLAIVSTKRREALLRGLHILGVAELFDTIVSNDDVVHVKPHAEPVLLALENLGLEKAQVIMIGDNYHDIEGGQNAGVHTAGVAWSLKGPEVLQQYNPTYLLYSMKDLLTIMEIQQYA
ncbi:pyrophosphatase PpaX [Kurthia sibirica]|uniref:Pyrophosphatase PpaX n=1 Tax=Kurthia sibirica TaxID=202750 RepID=A0A2U3AJB5_9BACL|nr:pyrophosphatase PpaX [Kurthia sibirica]PWI24627.1 pyrophosphatase PpaX [Kurthia sibirica]GEK33455.1 pyrophosphatase PpaX [Kurthia sibirica]